MNFLDIVEDWYNSNYDEISQDTVLFYLIDLFQQLKMAGFKKEDLPEVGERLIFLLNIDIEDKHIAMLYQRMLAEEINSAFSIVNKNIKEFKDEMEEFVQVRNVDDGDIYNTSEPDIDLRGVEFEGAALDEEFIRRLGIKNE